MEEKTMENKKTNNRRCQFWFLVVLSLLLIIVFIYYLPLRFEQRILEVDTEHSASFLVPIALANGDDDHHEVEKTGVFGPNGLLYTSTSLVLIGFLSWGVYKFLKVK
jgi:cell division septal protein FtsQ